MTTNEELKTNQEEEEVSEAVKQEVLTEDLDVQSSEAVNDEAQGEIATEKNIDIQALMAEFDNKYKRLQADFENFKRRTNQEKTQLATFIKSDIIEGFLPVLDNFARAMQTPVTEENKGLYDGLVMVQQGLMALLNKHGLAEIEAVGQVFDPNFHQAVMRAPSDEYDDDVVSEVLQTGYTVDGRTLRPAMVKVVSNS